MSVSGPAPGSPWWRTLRRRLAGQSARPDAAASGSEGAHSTGSTHSTGSGQASSPQASSGQALARQSRAWLEARTLVRAYYAGLLYLAFADAAGWEELAGRSEAGLLWPVLWMKATGVKAGALLVLAAHVGGALAAAVAPGRRWCRVLAALGLLQHTALVYSAGKIGHGLHLWVLTSLVLVFLPDGRAGGPPPGRRERQEFLNVFWTAHALVMLTYSMSGLGKVLGALWQASQGEVTAFHPQAMALHVADRLLETGGQSPVGLWLVNNTWAAWPMMLGAIYLQFFAFWAIFRPRLLALWTAGLILFHLATYFTLTIRFAPPVLLLALWGLASPFASEKATAGKMLAQMPLVGILARKWARNEK
jgi:hypothetical protein